MARFKKGQSGNPGGRPNVVGALRELARQHAPEAISELARLAVHAKNEATRVAAIRELLDRGFGKPKQPVGGDDEGGAPIDERLIIEFVNAPVRSDDVQRR